MVTADAEHGEHAAPPPERGPSPIAILFAPDRAMDRQARLGRARAYLFASWIASLSLAAARAVRVDAAASTLRKLEMSGQLMSMSDRQIGDETHSAERIFQVGTIAKAVVGAPLSLGLACLAVLFVAWFLRGRIKGSAVAPVAAATLLPQVIADLIDTATAVRHTTLPPDAVPLAPRDLAAVLSLAARPLQMPWVKLGHALDFYSLWAAILMGFGVAAAAQIPRRRAMIATLAGWVCYRLITQVALGGG